MQIKYYNIIKLSSPGDAALMRMKKRKKQKENEKVAPVNEVKIFGNTVQMCEEGLSPKISFTKKKYRKDEDSDSD